MSDQDWLDRQQGLADLHDDREPEDNIPDAVMDPPPVGTRTHSPSGMCLCWGCGGNIDVACEHYAHRWFATWHGLGSDVIELGGPRFFTVNEAVAFANAILAEVEIAQRTEAGEFEWTPTHVSVHDGSTARLVGGSDIPFCWTLENEAGDRWADPIEDWHEIAQRTERGEFE